MTYNSIARMLLFGNTVRTIAVKEQDADQEELNRFEK